MAASTLQIGISLHYIRVDVVTRWAAEFPFVTEVTSSNHLTVVVPVNIVSIFMWLSFYRGQLSRSGCNLNLNEQRLLG